MDLQKYKLELEENVIKMLISFIEEYDCADYTAEDVAQCAALVERYLEALSAMESPDDEAIMEQVESLVLALNELNEATDYALIETEAREALWEVIQNSAVDAGLREYSGDITEQWREW